jgi:hypothetical protein
LKKTVFPQLLFLFGTGWILFAHLS